MNGKVQVFELILNWIYSKTLNGAFYHMKIDWI